MDGVSIEVFQALDDDAVKVLTRICQRIWTTGQWPENWKRSVYIPIPKKADNKIYGSYRAIVLISHPSKIPLKIIQQSLLLYLKREMPEVQAGFRKPRGTRDHIVNI